MAGKFLIYWTLQAVWIYLTLLPVIVLNGTARNKGEPLKHRASELNYLARQWTHWYSGCKHCLPLCPAAYVMSSLMHPQGGKGGGVNFALQQWSSL